MAAGNDDCFVCAKHRGEVDVPGGVLYEDDLVYATHGELDEGAPAAGYPGVIFVEPRRHVPGWADLEPAEAERLGLVISRLARALEQGEGAERTYVFVLGHHVPHLHVWLVPRYPGTPDDVIGMSMLRWAGAPRADASEIAALCGRVRGHVAREDASGAAS